jgi:RNA polymerase sigma factor (sigma-70 family)
MIVNTERIETLTTPATNVALLIERLLPPTNDESARRVLSELVTIHAEPVIKSVVRYKLRLSSQSTGVVDAEDLCQDAVAQVLAELRRFREQPDAHAITDVRGLAAVIAHRACARWMRRQFPERHALKNRLRYILTRQNGLALWHDERDRLVAGFAAWRGRKTAAPGERLLELANDDQTAARIESLVSGGKKPHWADALAAIFNRVGGPIDFDKLVGAFAVLASVPMRPVENDATVTAAAAPDPAAQVEKRIFLQRAWEEVRRLPLQQRAALLLNLKDGGAGGCIALFPATGVANFRQIAETLELRAERFAELWNELPLEDSRIAELLKITRQQVINARRVARERLAKQLREFI